MLGKEVFTDLAFADNVAILSEMHEILKLALEIMHEESSSLVLDIKWSKSNQDSEYNRPSTVSVLNNQVDVDHSNVDRLMPKNMITCLLLGCVYAHVG